MSYPILIYSVELSAIGRHLQDFFKAKVCQDLPACQDSLQAHHFRAFIIDCSDCDCSDTGCYTGYIELAKQADIPAIVICQALNLQQKIAAHEVGCDDILDSRTSPDEATARVTKSIYHRIATKQLNERLQLASETAKNALIDNSDLGANIQFLLAVNSCDNLDQLGQLLFSTLERYGLKCSLQMRTRMEIKNMEAHGMSKDLESQLLYQLKDSGRYIDFGSRTLCNYDRVSLLIKNMPTEDKEKYGAIKDNSFYLLQGVNARLHALENQHTLDEEKKCLKKLSSDITQVTSSIKERYQDMMRSIVNEVETAALLIQDRIPHLALLEKDERYIDNIIERLITGTNQIFNEGLKVEDAFKRLESDLEKSIHTLDEHPELSGSQTFEKDNRGVDLF
jgi:hypothetical protein